MPGYCCIACWLILRVQNTSLLQFEVVSLVLGRVLKLDLLVDVANQDTYASPATRSCGTIEGSMALEAGVVARAWNVDEGAHEYTWLIFTLRRDTTRLRYFEAPHPGAAHDSKDV